MFLWKIDENENENRADLKKVLPSPFFITKHFYKFFPLLSKLSYCWIHCCWVLWCCCNCRSWWCSSCSDCWNCLWFIKLFRLSLKLLLLLLFVNDLQICNWWILPSFYSVLCICCYCSARFILFNAIVVVLSYCFVVNSNNIGVTKGRLCQG